MNYVHGFVSVFAFSILSLLLNLAFNDGDIEWVYLIASATVLFLIFPILFMGRHVLWGTGHWANFLGVVAVWIVMVSFCAYLFFDERKEFELKKSEFNQRISDLNEREPRVFVCESEEAPISGTP